MMSSKSIHHHHLPNVTSNKTDGQRTIASDGETYRITWPYSSNAETAEVNSSIVSIFSQDSGQDIQLVGRLFDAAE